MLLDYMLEKFTAFAQQDALIFNDQSFSYQWLSACIEKWSNIIEKETIPEGSVIAVHADFNPESIGLLLALIESKMTIVPISPAVKTPKQFEDIAQVEYAVSAENKSYKIEQRDRSAKHPILLELKNRKHPGLVLFSSGSTGDPKAAVHDIVPLLEKFKGRGKPFRTISFLLFDHIGGFNTLLYILSHGGTLITVNERSPKAVCKAIEQHRVELLPTTPTFINMILFTRAYERFDLTTLKIISYGTEPMPEITLKRFANLYPDIYLKQTYGLSELGIMRTKSESSNSLWVKVGGEDYAIKVVDNHLWIKAKTAMLGYLNAPSPFMEGGWFNTGDRVELKGEYLRFLGRESEIINVGGEKVYPAEVESVLLEIEGVLDASVHGEEHPMMGNIVVAKVAVSQENKNRRFIGTIKRYCQQKMEKYKIPVRIELNDEDFHSERFKRTR